MIWTVIEVLDNDGSIVYTDSIDGAGPSEEQWLYRAARKQWPGSYTFRFRTELRPDERKAWRKGYARALADAEYRGTTPYDYGVARERQESLDTPPADW